MRNCRGEKTELFSGSDFPEIGPIDENGSDYEENAAIKARAWADFAGIPAIADDSGLETRALNWEPGIYSARSVAGSDSDRTERLLSRMKNCGDRFARFVSCVVIAFPGGGNSSSDYFSSRGVCNGSISRKPHGSAGFGYDPVFVPEGFNVTFAEMGTNEKSKISHRAIAMLGIAHMMPSVLKYYNMRCG